MKFFKGEAINSRTVHGVVQLVLGDLLHRNCRDGFPTCLTILQLWRGGNWPTQDVMHHTSLVWLVWLFLHFLKTNSIKLAPQTRS